MIWTNRSNKEMPKMVLNRRWIGQRKEEKTKVKIVIHCNGRYKTHGYHELEDTETGMNGD